MIKIYTDGACIGNPGPGGWAAIIVHNKDRVEIKGQEKETTSNRMEIKAAIEGLKKTPEGSEIAIYSDSQYLINTMTQNWKRQANLDLWQTLDELVAARKVSWGWLKGHSGYPENERANELAEEMANIASLPSSGVSMVDISQKQETERIAVAKGAVAMKPETIELIEQGKIPKGNVLTVAQTAGIMAAKKTPELIPLCHPLLLTDVIVELELNKEKSVVEITATVKSTGKTGVEMEALTATAVSALTIYDMCKQVERGIKIQDIHLIKKSGGKSGTIILE